MTILKAKVHNPKQSAASAEPYLKVTLRNFVDESLF